MISRYRVDLLLRKKVFGFVPGLPGCWSQGATKAEALDNIRDAIHEYLQAAGGSVEDPMLREAEV